MITGAVLGFAIAALLMVILYLCGQRRMLRAMVADLTTSTATRVAEGNESLKQAQAKLATIQQEVKAKELPVIIHISDEQVMRMAHMIYSAIATLEKSADA